MPISRLPDKEKCTNKATRRFSIAPRPDSHSNHRHSQRPSSTELALVWHNDSTASCATHLSIHCTMRLSYMQFDDLAWRPADIYGLSSQLKHLSLLPPQFIANICHQGLHTHLIHLSYHNTRFQARRTKTAHSVPVQLLLVTGMGFWRSVGGSCGR